MWWPIVDLVPTKASQRLTIAAAGGLVSALLLHGEAAPLRVLVAWDVFAFVLLTLVWVVSWRSDAGAARKRAAASDPGRRTIWLLAIAASTVSLFAAIGVLRQARNLAPQRAVIWVVLCLAAVALSWLVTQTSWSLRYEHLYYRDDADGIGGLVFPGDRAPDSLDFAYFAFTIGICFQTSDVSITDAQIRRTVLFHSCLSYAYATAIVALALNVTYGFIS